MKMRDIIGKTLMLLACSIIMLHAVVPHHHHCCADELGFVFEDEVECHCDGDHHHSHHPFDTCKLQDLLSHLVLTTKDESFWCADHACVDLYLPSVWNQCSLLEQRLAEVEYLQSRNASLLPIGADAYSVSRRGPPAC